MLLAAAGHAGVRAQESAPPASVAQAAEAQSGDVSEPASSDVQATPVAAPPVRDDESNGAEAAAGATSESEQAPPPAGASSSVTAYEPPPSTASASLQNDALEQPSDQQPATQKDGVSAAQSCGAGSLALTSGGCTKRWRVIGYGEFRTLAVRDETPRNDEQMRFFAQGSYRLLREHNLQAWARVRFLQRFTTEEEESGALLQDPLIGSDYLHAHPLDALGWSGRSVSLQHRLSFAVPVSRQSQNNDLYTALNTLNRARIDVLPSLFVGVDTVFEYRFYRYAEAPGPQGTPLPRAAFEGTVVAEYYPFQDTPFGSLLVGADIGGGLTRTYEARGADDTATGEAAEVQQRLAWDAYLYYLPVPYVWIGMSVEQTGPVLRDGVVNPTFTHRDQTQLVASVTALY